MRYVSLILLLSFAIIQLVQSQDVYYHVGNTQVYQFLDELAGEKVIELNAVVKPYSREFIAGKLAEADSSREWLNKRQKEELDFYLKDFNKELKPGKNFNKRFDIFYYKDSLFTLSLNAVLGFQYWNNANGDNYHRWNGAEAFACIGKHFGAYASLRDNHEKIMFSNPAYLNKRPAARYKSGQDYSEMRGGLTWSWKWGTVGLVKDHIEWGNYNNYPSILSAKPPSFAHIKLNIRPVHWFEFNYIHGWLVSGVTDSVNSYTFTNPYGTGTRAVYRNKYIAANMFSFQPFENFHASFGNSIIYSDMNIHPAYLIPFLLYKSVDHTLNQNLTNSGGQNSALFFDLSSKQIKHLHLFATIFFDDLSITRLKENGHFDFYSLKAGFRISNLISNISFSGEYFQSYPLVYKHDMPTTTYESNFYTLGHYLQDNSRAFYFDLTYRPSRGLSLKTFYNFEQHGTDHESLGTPRIDVVNRFLDEILWENHTIGFRASYQVINDAFLFVEIDHRKITGEIEKYTPEFYHNNPSTLSLGLYLGL